MADSSELPTQTHSESESDSSESSCSKTRNEEEMGILIKEFRYQLMLEDQQIEKGKYHCLQLVPTQDQLQQAIDLLQQKIPDKDSFKIVKQLYRNLIPQNLLRSKRKVPSKPCNEEEVREALYQSSPFFKIQSNIAAVENLLEFRGFKKVYLQSVWKAPCFQSDPSLGLRFKLKQLVAKSFVERNHSVDEFRRVIEEQNENIVVDGERYKSALESVAIEAYRFMEEFILTECQIKINRLARQEIRMMCARLFHCRETLRKEECDIFLGLIKIIYGLCDVSLDQYFTVKFYWTTQKGLRLIMLKRMSHPGKLRAEPAVKEEDLDDTKSIIYDKTVKDNCSLELQNIWSTKIQKEFIEVYKTTQHFVHIKAYFKEKHPEYQEFFRGNGLKNRLFQILRASMRKVRDIVDKFNVKEPELVKLNDDRIKYIMKSTRALKARLLLVDAYLDDNKTYTERIEEVIRQINLAVKERIYPRSMCNVSTISSDQCSISEFQNSKVQAKKEKRKQIAKEKRPYKSRKQKVIKNPIVQEYLAEMKLKSLDELLQDDNISEMSQALNFNDHEGNADNLDRYMQDEESAYPIEYSYFDADCQV